MTRLELEAQISRAQTCLQNATDPQDQRHWWDVMKDAIERRNAQRTPEEVERIEKERGLR